MLSDAELSIFACLYSVLIPLIPSIRIQREKIAPFGCGIMKDYGFRHLVLAFVCDNLSKNSSGHLSNTQRHRMTIENLIFDGQVDTLFSENKTMLKF